MTTQTRGGSWIRRFHPAPDRPVRLVLLPHAGGSASFYLPLSEALSAQVDVLTIQYPGRLDRLSEPCLSTIEELTDGVLAELVPWLDRPTVLFGHSMGAAVAFEVAGRLEREHGVVPRHLVVSGRREPADNRDETVHLRDDDGLLDEVAALSGTDPRVFAEPELRAMILPALRADYRAIETYTYRPGPPLRCPILALTGGADPRVSVEEAGRWCDYTTGQFDLEIFPGGHFYLTDQRTAVASAVLSRLGL
ncbi:MAG TPA: alpha/beta fold hydrolase [Actinophytocola sp.]|uniref:thioesterase II family protein n=1 Tax=Actinophytocola sp. TaxID=1872138 RepID=UPI002DF78AAA|nr:alpha/beta fold hydrolase [Actinophytocola sp.]